MSWALMDKANRAPAGELQRSDIPTSPGVYALYRGGERMYVGKATSLQARVGGQHGGKGASMTNSALRRNVCQLLGIASAADIKARRYLTTRADADRVTEWLSGCTFAWIECATPADALALETRMRAEFKPPLNML
jgi:excinuclease UvrABC nuclease subunit